MRFYFLIALKIIFLGIIPTAGKAQQQENIILVIDPGHGGNDPGKPKGSKAMKHEKDINLAIALRLGEYIHHNLPDVKVLYTRSSDVYVSLEDRVEFANKHNATYFLSIHANSSPNANVHGLEVHIHSHKMPASAQWAKCIEEELGKKANRHNRGTLDAKDRGKNLFVTQRPKMPSILVETGYLTNKDEEKFLNTGEGQAIIASALYRAFKKFTNTKTLPEVRDKVYRVQIMASKTKIAIDSSVFEDLDYKVEEIETPNAPNGYRYKYLIGYEYDNAAAWQLAKKVEKLGYKGAFVIKVDND
jgi:N-acetylmuramoyl-L-alanine amidase